MSCDAAIRPFPNDTEVRCEGEHADGASHAGTLRDYAYEGSETHIEWEEGDRRTFHGQWPGPCPKLDPPNPPFTGSCVLPSGHPGRCAS